MSRLAFLLAPVALLVAGAAQADRSWLLPSSTILSGSGNVITVDAAGSERLFAFDHRAMQLDAVKVWKPDGSEGEKAAPSTGRLRSVFDVKLDQPGTWKIGSRQTMVMGSFKLNGEERRVGGRMGPPPGGGAGGAGGPGGPPGAGAAGAPPQNGPGGGPGMGAPGGPPPGSGGEAPRRLPPVAVKDIPAEATDISLTEMVNTIETFVSVGDPTTTVLKPTGQGLELDPITHPNDLAEGETARFRFLVDGKPTPGVQVTVIEGGDRYRNITGEKVLTTGADGTIAIKWASAGMYWLGATITDTHPAEPRAKERRMTYVATLEVMTP